MTTTTSVDQSALDDHVERFLREVCPVDILHKAFDGDHVIAASIWRGMLELGLGGVTVPEAYGGLGLGLQEAAGLGERIGWAGAPGPWLGHTLAAIAIARAGSEAQRSTWLPSMASGEIGATVALSEGGVWRAEDWSLAAEPRLTGAKDYVLGLDTAGLVVVGLKGGRLGLVELGGPGVSVVMLASTDRTRPVGRLVFDNAPVDLLPEAFGPPLVDAALILLAADAHGGATRMLEDIVAYTNERVQFDRVLASFQAIKHKLADLAMAISPNGPLYRQAAASYDLAPGGASLTASMTKALVTETFSAVARTATEAYGGIGYTWEHHAHIWLRRALFDHAWLGSPTAHRQRAADLLGW
jgi:alkylation response protein AidB-like acyl-CoA dehydrogenase